MEDLKHRVENLKKEKDKLDDQWADQFGTTCGIMLAVSDLVVLIFGMLGLFRGACRHADKMKANLEKANAELQAALSSGGGGGATVVSGDVRHMRAPRCGQATAQRSVSMPTSCSYLLRPPSSRLAGISWRCAKPCIWSRTASRTRRWPSSTRRASASAPTQRPKLRRPRRPRAPRRRPRRHRRVRCPGARLANCEQ